MQFDKLILLMLGYFAFASVVDARRVRVRPRPVESEPESEEDADTAVNEEDNQPQSAIQYYDSDSREDNSKNRVVLISSDDDYNGVYGQPTLRSRADYNRPSAHLSRSSTSSPKTKDQATKTPPVQTIRNYSKVNDDGSFTFGYEAADGSFKEETRGTDCVVRGKYGYIDPDGNKREFTYVSGNPCDPNNPDGKESDEERESAEGSSQEDENVPQNYPKRPVRPVRPVHTTPTSPTTVFQNTYSQHSYAEDSEEEDPEPIQVLQPQRQYTPTSVRPLEIQSSKPSEVSIRQRPQITINTTPSSINLYKSPTQSVSITPRPTYRTPISSLRSQPPATTYRPAIKITPQQATVSYSKTTSRPGLYTPLTLNSISSTTRRPLDFAAEFQKFQNENRPETTTVRTTTPYKSYKPLTIPKVSHSSTSNPIYESQLVFDPSSGQYDSALYQQLPQTDGEFQLSHKIQPYVYQYNSAPQLLSLEQLQQSNPSYQGKPTAVNSPNQSPFSQQTYEKEKENLQVLNSQQLFHQQQQLQQQQLQQDRIEAARKALQSSQSNSFQPQLQKPVSPQTQGFYYIQPPSSQIDAFLRGHNINL